MRLFFELFKHLGDLLFISNNALCFDLNVLKLELLIKESQKDEMVTNFI